MKQHKVNIFQRIMLCLLLSFGSFSTAQENRPAVLHIEGGNNYTSHFDTQTKLTSDLISKGILGQASLEFWAMAGPGNGGATYEGWRISNLQTGDAKFEMIASRDVVSVAVGNSSLAINLPDDSKLLNSQWNHFTLVIQADLLRIYINGIQRALVPYVQISPEFLYMSTAPNDHLYVTEYRAWTSARSQELIEGNRYRSLYDETPNSLAEFLADGLVIAYVNNSTEEASINQLQELSSSQWNNALASLSTEAITTSSCRITSQYANLSKPLARVRTDTDHPIYALTDILLTASDGDGISNPNNTSGQHGVLLSWPHIDGAVSYRIGRRNNTNTSTEIGQINNISNEVVSAMQHYFDAAVLPNEIYTYSVTPVLENGGTGAAGIDAGFVFSNGTVEGTIQTSLGVATQEALIEAIAEGDSNPGSALEFQPDSSEIVVRNIEIFRQANDAATIEFWYKSNANGNNTVFTLGAMSINIEGATFKVKNNYDLHIEASRTDDGNWHHYAFAYGADGVVLYEDGYVMNNGVTNSPLALELNVVTSFEFNKEVNQTYQLDEFRIWKGKRDDVQIYNNYNHILGSDEANLLAYYRFDLNDAKHIYNQASETLGAYKGESESTLNHLAADAQPNIIYGTFTDVNGRYAFTSLNSGRQGVTNNGNAFTFRVVPSKPNHEFMPGHRIVDVDRVLQPEAEAASFTDTSVFSVSGRLVYRVPNASAAEGYDIYPGLIGTGINLDGVLVNSIDPNAGVSTDADGVFVISAGIGQHAFEVAQQNTGTSGGISTSNANLDLRSLDFDGSTGYAVSNEKINTSNNSFTWSGFVKPDIEADPNAFFSPIQTVLHWGDIIVELRNNNQLYLVVNGVDKLSSLIAPEQTFYTFFAVTYNPENNVIAFQVDNNYQTEAWTSGLNIDKHVYLGAKNTISIDNEFINFSRANMDILEYRNTVYTNEQLNSIRTGDIILNDVDYLKLSYSFEHRRGTRALNLIAANASENNYLRLEGNSEFTDTSTSAYKRAFEYEYRAYNDAFNPAANSAEYVLNVTEPISSLNFENTTRRTFFGNIVVPCNYNVGDWTGSIKRTDIEFPAYELSINSSNFNSEGTIFSVEGLIPGQYIAELTNVETGASLQSSIIDLREGNNSFDFQYRNDIEMSLSINGYNLEGINMNGEITQEDFLNRFEAEYQPLCDGNYNIPMGTPIIVTVDVFERYGDNTCPVQGAQVDFSGDMIIGANGTTSDSEGRVYFFTQTDTPNFIGLTRALNIAVGHESRAINENRTAYITGAQRSNSDFTLVNPMVGYILHDPPGDGSTATLELGSSYGHSYSFEEGTDVSVGLSAGIGFSTEVELTTLAVVAPLGVGTAIGTVSTGGSLSSSAGVSATTNFNYRKTSGTGYSVSLSQSITTPSFDDYVGQDADVYIGTSNVLTFGTGRELVVDNCVASIVNNRKVMTAEEQTPFVFTQQQILDEVIPDLQRLIITKVDELNGTVVSSLTPEEQALRNSLNLSQTIANIISDEQRSDEDILDYFFQINTWSDIIAENKSTLLADNFMNAPDFASTTSGLSTAEDSALDLGSIITSLDEEIAFSAGPTITYNIARSNSSASGEVVGGGVVAGFVSDFSANVFGGTLTLNASASISGVRNNVINDDTGNSRVDSFTLADDDTGDQFNVRIRRDPRYDTPMFLTTAGQSQCPFESGTVPRNGVEIVADQTVGYGTGEESILFNLTLRNTQVAADNTPKIYVVAMDGASNPLGAVVLLNESPIFEPATSSPIVFALDGNSGTGVRQEVTAQLRISRGTNAPANISYENIGVRIYAQCEQDGFGYISYRQDEYAEVGVVPFQEIKLTAHFNGACIDEILPSQPQEDWVVNNTDNNELDFRFRIPELTADNAPENFSVLLEYAIEGNNTPLVLEELSVVQLQDNLQADGYITYGADVSALTNGTYRFRVSPYCDDGGANAPASRLNPTPYVTGTIVRDAPVVVSTNPIVGGVLTDGTISARFASAINPATANNTTLSLRGILGGVPGDLISGSLTELMDEVTIPHQPLYNISGAFTAEMWVNPARFPNGADVAIFNKGDNYKMELTSSGFIQINDVVTSTVAIQPQAWTHIAAVYDGIGAIQLYFNGTPVGSGAFENSLLVTNGDAITIAATLNNDAYVGLIDEVRLWTTARSPLEIVTNIDKQLLGNETDLIAYFVFDDNALEGVDGAPNEAIRDFTGNATGTTATGLSFVTGEEVAAPLDLSRMVQDLQFEVQVSEGNTVLNIIPVFTNQELEGAQLMMLISDRKLQDPAGNLIEGTSWDFVINRNVIAWSQNNINVLQTQGIASQISTIDLVNEDSGIPIDYRFVGLPSWITVIEGADATDVNTIAAGHINSNLIFETAPYLNAGIHTANVNIETFNSNTGIPLGTETFHVEVTVNCAAPDYSAYDSNAYLGNMDLVGQLIIEGIQSFDSNDIVAVYLDGALRGSAQVANDGHVHLPVFGNNEKGILTFRVWDASDCTEYQGIIENYNYVFRGLEGSESSPVTFTVGDRLTKRISLVPGFQEISFNVKDNPYAHDFSLTSIEGLTVGDEIRDVVTTEILATVNTDGSLTGSGTVDVRKAFIIKSAANSNTMIEVTGVAVPINTDITINTGFNGVAYFPNDLQRTSFALRSLTSTTISEGDRISRRGLFATYDTEIGWTGSLTHLVPGLGYLYTASDVGVLNYSGIATSGMNARSSNNLITNRQPVEDQGEPDVSYLNDAARIGWDVDVNMYPTFMYVDAILTSDDIPSDQPYMVAAFIDGEIRGVAKVEKVNDNYHYFIGIGGGNEGTVSFQLYDGHQISSLDNSLSFERDLTLGTLEEPYELTFKKRDESDLKELVGYVLSQNVPNPLVNFTRIKYSVPNDMHVDISLYNIFGQKVHSFVDQKVQGNISHTIEWNNTSRGQTLPSGVYIYELNAGGEKIQRKLIIK